MLLCAHVPYTTLSCAAQAVHRLCSLHDEHSTLHLRVHAHLSSSSLPACQASNTGPLTVSRLYPVRPPRYSLSPSPLPLVKVLPLPDVSAHAYSPPPPRELTRYLCPSCAMQTRAGPSSTSSSSLSPSTSSSTTRLTETTGAGRPKRRASSLSTSLVQAAPAGPRPAKRTAPSHLNSSADTSEGAASTTALIRAALTSCSPSSDTTLDASAVVVQPWGTAAQLNRKIYPSQFIDRCLVRRPHDEDEARTALHCIVAAASRLASSSPRHRRPVLASR